MLAWAESQMLQAHAPNGVRERDSTSENQRMKRRPSSSTIAPECSMSMPASSSSLLPASSARRIGGKDALSYAAILRMRNKFVEALNLYDSVLEVEPRNVDAHVGKGICLQMQGLSRQAFDSFSDALSLDPQNACALTHCGILYKEEGHLLQAAEVCNVFLLFLPNRAMAM